MDKIYDFKIAALPSYVHRTLPVLTSVNNSISLPPTPLMQHILPSFFTFFTGPLAANLVYTNFYLTQDLFLSYLSGIIIFYTLKLFPFLLYTAKVAPFIGRIFLITDMKNKGIPIHFACMWIMFNFLVSLVVSKIVNNKKIDMTNSEFSDLMGIVFCLLFARYFKLCDFFCAILVFGVDVVNKAVHREKSASAKSEVGERAIRKMSLDKVEIQKKNAKAKNAKAENAKVENVKAENSSESEEVRMPKRRGRPRKTDL